MSDYIIQMKVSELKPNPINSTIYNDNPDTLKELIHSINLNGLLEPLVINRSNMVISGHRRLKALKEIGWEKCDCRLSEFENEIIALIQLNSYRIKVESEIVREAEILKTEYSKQIKKGRPLKGEVREGKNWSIVNVSEKLGVSTTKLKKLISIKKHEPSLLEKVDLGLISVEQAYQKVRLKYIVGENDEKYNNSNFKSSFNQLLKRYNPPFDVVYQSVLKNYIEPDGFDSFDIIKGQTGLTALGNIREETDFYPTPPQPTKSFLKHEKLEGVIWEPACGKGHISKCVEKIYGSIESTDLYDRGYGKSGVDFLDDENKKKVDTIITNPPFSLFTDFVEKSKELASKKICLFGKTSYLEGRDRYNRL